MIKLILTIIICSILLPFFSMPAQAQNVIVSDACQGVGEGGCGTSTPPRICVRENFGTGPDRIAPTGATCGPGQAGRSVLGGVQAPMAIREISAAAGGVQQGIGIVLFISNLLTLFTIIVGIWVLFNVLKAGALFINAAGDAGNFEKVREILTTSVIGVTIIASAYILAGAIGWVIFGDPSFILRPTLMGAI